MGKRRSRKAAPKKAMQKLPSTFDCPFCNHTATVRVKLLLNAKVGQLECRVCGVKEETRITHLSKEIDVYCEWMDSCLEQNNVDEPEFDEYGSKRRKLNPTDEAILAAQLEGGSDDGSIISDGIPYEDTAVSEG